eukprot:4918700-Alexandrium_andersonii.AAC.1
MLATAAPPKGQGRTGGVALLVPLAGLALLRSYEHRRAEGHFVLADLEGGACATAITVAAACRRPGPYRGTLWAALRRELLRRGQREVVIGCDFN